MLTSPELVPFSLFHKKVNCGYQLGFGSPATRGPSYLGENLHWLGLQEPKGAPWPFPGS